MKLLLRSAAGLPLVASCLIQAALATSYCGTDAEGLCVDRNVAIQPCTGSGTSNCSVAQWVTVEGMASFGDCSAACLNTYFGNDKQCQSFEFYFSPNASNSAGGFVCNAFYPAVQQYLAECSLAFAEPITNFYNLICSSPNQSTTGTVPQHPSTNNVTGTCNSERVWNGNQHQFIGDYVAEQISNVTLSDCSKVCKHTNGCKSYFYNGNAEGYSQKINSTIQTPDFYTSCIFFSQPVMEYTTEGKSGEQGHFYDRNCPV